MKLIKLSLLISNLLFSVVLNAQFRNYELNQLDTLGQEYIGRDYVRLMPGYHFKAKPGEVMKANVNKSLTDGQGDGFLTMLSESQKSALELKTDGLVGSIPIESSVGPTGAKCYKVPIDLPKGRVGFKPTISLTYNSQSGNGPLGMGWSLEGISSIEREGKNRYFDGENGSINHNSDDHFSLNGNRLIQIKKSATLIEYETAQGNIKVFGYLTGEVLTFFKVNYPDGSVGRYGYANNTSHKLTYPITLYKDRFGNVQLFNYLNETSISGSDIDNDLYYIQSIHYGGIVDKNNVLRQKCVARVLFTYTDDRPDRPISLKAGRSIYIRQRLSKIDCYSSVLSSALPIRSYHLNYSDSLPDGKSLLTTITQMGLGDAVLNPLRFFYGERKPSNVFKETKTLPNSNFDLRNYCLQRGKFDSKTNGDAILLYPRKTAGYAITDSIRIYQSLDDTQPSITKIATGGNFLSMLCANIDGVDKDELVRVEIGSASNIFRFAIYKVGASNSLELERNVTFGAQEQISHGNDYLVGDFSGGGHSEILAINQGRWLYLVNLSNSVASIQRIGEKGTADRIVALDVDGDGQTEILHINARETYVLKYSVGKGFVRIGTWALTLQEMSERQILFADLNGDGFVDIVRSPKANEVKVDVVKGPGWFAGPLRVHRNYVKCPSCSYVQHRLFFNPRDNNRITCNHGVGAILASNSYIKRMDGEKYPIDYSDERIQKNPYYMDKIHSSDNYPILDAWFPRVNSDYKTATTVCPGCAGTFNYTIPVWDAKTCWNCNRKLQQFIWNDNGYCMECHFALDAKDWYRDMPKVVEYNDWIYELTDGRKICLKRTVNGVGRKNDMKFSIHEANGDHTPDLVIQQNGSMIVIPFDVNNLCFSPKDQIPTDNLPQSYEYVAYDPNSGHPNTHLLALGENKIHKLSFTHNHTYCSMMTLMVNSLGVAEKTEYGQLIEGDNYKISRKDDFPYTTIQAPMWVTVRNSTYCDRQIGSHNEYVYYDAISHKQGLGWCGFYKIQSTDLLRNQSSSTYYNPTMRGVVTQVHTEQSETTFEHSLTVASNKKMVLRLIAQTEKNLLTGNIEKTTYSNFDSFNTPLKKVITFGQGITNTEERIVRNESSFDRVMIGLPLSVTTTVANVQDVHKQTDSYVYSSDLRLTEMRKDRIQNGASKQFEKTQLFYNSYDGNMVKKVITNHLNDQFITQYGYSGEEGNLISVIDPLNQKTELVYDQYLRLESKIDRFGKTVYEYDALGRNNKIIYPDQTATSISLSWVNNGSDRVIEETLTRTGMPTSFRYFDRWGRETRSSEVGFDGRIVSEDVKYDTFGSPIAQSLPYKEGEEPLWQYSTFDRFGRINQTESPGGSKTTYSYHRNSITQNTNGKAVTQTTDPLGRLVTSSDAGGTVIYHYRADNQIASIHTNGVALSYEYNDPLGRKTKEIDPSSGEQTISYDDANRSITHTWSSGKSMTVKFNDKGQLISKITPDVQAEYLYDGALMTTVNMNNGFYQRKATFDALGRVSSLMEKIDGNTFNESVEYESGRIKSIYNGLTGCRVYYHYNAHNYLYKTTYGDNKLLREVKQTNSQGKELEVHYGNAIVNYNSYTPEGYLTRARSLRKAAILLIDQGYEVDRKEGKILERYDHIRGLSESFSYGDLSRLEQYGPATNRQSVSYDQNGNITNKSDAGGFDYEDSSRPYHLTSIDTQVPQLSKELSIDYSITGYVRTITVGARSTSFQYNDLYDRIVEEFKINGYTTLTKKMFAGGKFEIINDSGVTKWRLYLDGSPYTASAVMEYDGDSRQLFFLHRDNMGSITHISDEIGNLVSEYSYDAWGRLRQPDNWNYYPTSTEPTPRFERGYTGHEHLPLLGVIHMNARLYDPILGRFITPDPKVSDPTVPNDYNRYVYARNNPLLYVDLTGESSERRGDGWGPGITPSVPANPGGIGANQPGYQPNGGGFSYSGGAPAYSGNSASYNLNSRGGVDVSVSGVTGLLFAFANWLFGDAVESEAGRCHVYNYINNSKVDYPRNFSLKPVASNGYSSVYSGIQKLSQYLTPENIHTSLDVAGIADPTFLCDGANSLLYLFEGEFVDAGISAVAMVPYIGDFGKAARLGKKVGGVYEVYTKTKKYPGQSKDLVSRINQHFNSKPPKFNVDEVVFIKFYEMPGSTRFEREVYEHFRIVSKGGLGSLFFNKRLPMGGRTLLYDNSKMNVIRKYNLPLE